MISRADGHNAEVEHEHNVQQALGRTWFIKARLRKASNSADFDDKCEAVINKYWVKTRKSSDLIDGHTGSSHQQMQGNGSRLWLPWADAFEL